MDIKARLKEIPSSPGVYIFRDKEGKVLYIGKAKILKKRVSSYFIKKSRDVRVARMVGSVADIDYVPTASEAEALIYEASLIKEKNPKFNIDLKDGKTYPFLKLTVKEKYPRLIVARDLKRDKSLYFGPYTDAAAMRRAVAIMKRLFPLRSCNKMPKKACLHFQIGQCLGPCVVRNVDTVYKKTVADLKLFLKGKKKLLLKRISERMKKYSDNAQYEKALQERQKLEAFTALLDQSSHNLPLDSDLKILKDVLNLKTIPARIEAFDISNISGRNAAGSMVTFFNAKPLKSDYRRFKIRTVADIDDYAMIKEIIRRRYKRLIREKRNMPDLILIDGGKGHLNAALEEAKALGLQVPIISIAKQNEEIFAEKRSEPLDIPRNSKALYLLERIRDEAHRFAISYHKWLRKDNFINGGNKKSA